MRIWRRMHMLPGGVLVGAAALTLSTSGAWGQATTTPRDELDVTTYEVVYTVPGMSGVSVRADLPFKYAPGGGTLRLDVYHPPGFTREARLPAVVFVNGVGEPALKGWPIYRSWARLVAGSGFTAVTFESRRPQVRDDIRDLFDYLRTHAAELGIDTDRVGLWSCSGNAGPALAYVSSDAGAWLKAAVVYYGWVDDDDMPAIRREQPFFLVRAGRDDPELNRRLAALAARAVTADAPWTVVNAPRLTHAFDGLDDGPESRQAIRDTLAFFDRHLRPELPYREPISLPHRALNHLFGHELPEAAEAYGELVKQRPTDAALRVRLAGLELQLRHLPEAVASYETAISLGQRGWGTYYNLACAHALAGDRDKAFVALDKAVGAGFADTGQLATDEDLASLHADPRYAALVQRLRR